MYEWMNELMYSIVTQPMYLDVIDYWNGWMNEQINVFYLPLAIEVPRKDKWMNYWLNYWLTGWMYG